jgi:hypothetical protein
VLNECRAAGTPVEVVWGSAPGWSDPWSRARRVRIVSLDQWSVVVEGEGQQWPLSPLDIQAIRPSPGPS